ncbi:MAG: hypothetical protein O2943_08275 [Actinomycetota bacterium]|nr:hypothetical protein [Actinomycetota bacterium]
MAPQDPPERPAKFSWLRFGRTLLVIVLVGVGVGVAVGFGTRVLGIGPLSFWQEVLLFGAVWLVLAIIYKLIRGRKLR